MFIPRSEKTRQFIIEKTAPIFNRKGYAGTSMADLTEATGLTKGSIYGNFENKEEVALAAFDYNHTQVAKQIMAQVDKAQTAKDKLLAYITAYSKLAGSTMFENGGCPLLNTGMEADDTHEPLRKRVEAGLTTWRNHLVTIVTKGIKTGEFKNDVDAGKMAVTIIAMIQGGVFLAKTTRQRHQLDVVLEAVTALINSTEVE